MITKIRDQLADWDHDNPERPDSLTIFVSDDGYDFVCEELDKMDQTPEWIYSADAKDCMNNIEGIHIDTDPMLEGSDVRVAPRDPGALQPGYVEEPLVAHVRRCVFPERQGPMLVAHPWFKVTIPCDEHDGHEVEKRIPIVVPDVVEEPEETIYRQAAAMASGAMELEAIDPDTGQTEELELDFEGILIA